MRRSMAVLAILTLTCAACGSSGTGNAQDVAGDPAADVPADIADAIDPGTPDTPEDTADVPAPDSVDDGDAPAADVPADVPDVPWIRPEKGDPVTAEETATVTDLYLDLLAQMNYFGLLDERVHGWPESDPAQGYWYGSWWSGVRILKADGKVTYLHSPDGADNNGMRTAPMLVGTAFVHQLGGKAENLHLLRRLVRGYNSWILAMERTSQPEGITMMTRASYPPSTTWTWGGREVTIDYSLNHPGEDNGACQYVHIPDNPYWGDYWVKNKRSKDDIGHLLLSIALVKGAVEAANDPDLNVEWAQLLDLYGKWSRQVEDDGWRIATYDKDLAPWFPEDDLAYYIMDVNGIDPECDVALATRLMGRGDAGTLDCENGISIIDDVVSMKPSNGQQLRSYHEAAIALARVKGRPDLVATLLPGLALRIDKILDGDPANGDPPRPGDEDLGELMIMADAVGVPLTWREVRFAHDRIRDAHAAYLTEGAKPGYNVFDAATPDGEYSFDPGGGGFAFRYLGAVLSFCASPFRHPDAHPVLDCDRVRAALAD
jgi:hypothetical protein